MIVGLTGKAGSGKDTVAGILKRRFGFRRDAFADSLRMALDALNPMVAVESELLDPSGRRQIRMMYISELHKKFQEEGLTDWLDRWNLMKTNPHIRRLLQRLGTEVGRDILGPRTWIDLVLKRAEGQGNTAVTDVRFLNEAAAIREAGGAVWRIDRPVGALDLGENARHPSETELDSIEVDVVILNDGSLDDLEQKVLWEASLLEGVL